MKKEIWKDIPGYEGFYQISNLGKVRSLNRYVKSKNNSIKLLKSKRMTISIYDVGYEYICLSKKGKRIKHKIHRLVALAFIPNPNNKPEVNHINGIKHDNNYLNLEWATSSENQQHAYRTGLQIPQKNVRTGIKNSNSKQVLKYDLHGELLDEYECARIAAEKHMVATSSITESCRTGKIKVRGFVWKYKN